MGVRPPSNDIDDEPDVIEFGIAALDARLDEESLSYPISAAELDERYGKTEIPYDATGHTIQLASALAAVDRTEFDSQRDLLNALHPVFERKREATSTSLLSQLRALVPF